MTLAETLAAAGFLAAEDEAALLIDAAGGDEERLAALVARRLDGEPVEHVVGWTEFCGLRLVVAPRTFVPRQKTEGLAERAAARLGAADDPVAVDLCSGVGAIACVMAARVPPARVVASELDKAALACLRANAATYGIEAVAGDLDAGLPHELRGRVAVLTANAPYVPTGDIQFLPREARLGEPVVALDGGADGLDVIRRVIAVASGWLRPGGHLLCEIGGAQGPASLAAFAASGFTDVAFTHDDDDIPRVVEGRRPQA